MQRRRQHMASQYHIIAPSYPTLSASFGRYSNQLESCLTRFRDSAGPELLTYIRIIKGYVDELKAICDARETGNNAGLMDGDPDAAKEAERTFYRQEIIARIGPILLKLESEALLTTIENEIEPLVNDFAVTMDQCIDQLRNRKTNHHLIRIIGFFHIALNLGNFIRGITIAWIFFSGIPWFGFAKYLSSEVVLAISVKQFMPAVIYTIEAIRLGFNAGYHFFQLSFFKKDNKEEAKVSVFSMMIELKTRAITNIVSAVLSVVTVVVFALTPYGWLCATGVLLTTWVGDSFLPLLRTRKKLEEISNLLPQDQEAYNNKLFDTVFSALEIIGLGLFSFTPFGFVTVGAVGSYISGASTAVTFTKAAVTFIKFVVSKVKKRCGCVNADSVVEEDEVESTPSSPSLVPASDNVVHRHLSRSPISSEMDSGEGEERKLAVAPSGGSSVSLTPSSPPRMSSRDFGSRSSSQASTFIGSAHSPRQSRVATPESSTSSHRMDLS